MVSAPRGVEQTSEALRSVGSKSLLARLVLEAVATSVVPRQIRELGEQEQILLAERKALLSTGPSFITSPRSSVRSGSR